MGLGKIKNNSSILGKSLHAFCNTLFCIWFLPTRQLLLLPPLLPWQAGTPQPVSTCSPERLPELGVFSTHGTLYRSAGVLDTEVILKPFARLPEDQCDLQSMKVHHL